MHRFLRSDGAGFLAIFTFVLVLLAVKGGGTSSVVNTAFGETFEESALVMNTQPSASQLFDINSFSGKGYSIPSTTSNLNTLQGSSLMPYASVLTSIGSDYDSSDSNSAKTYEVQAGDTISGIAVDFGVSVATILASNNIKNADAIKPGTNLKIPPINGIFYTVKKGDTVGAIASRYKTDEDKIISFNRLSLSGDLQIGNEIIIPDAVITSATASHARNQDVSSLRFVSLPQISGYYITPASCVITQLLHIRNGIDCANKVGTPIYAAASGTVDLVKYGKTGYGNYIRISHDNGTKTLYGHLSKMHVKNGEVVAQGQQIGDMGNTGRSTGSHLHYEIHGAGNNLLKYGYRAIVTAGN